MYRSCKNVAAASRSGHKRFGEPSYVTHARGVE